MVTIERRIGTLALSVTITNRNNRIAVRGEVYPFVNHFHCASFSVDHRISGNHDVIAKVSGFGGNSFALDDASRMIEAVQVAYQQASYYKDMIRTLIDGKYYSSVMKQLLDGKDSETVMDALLLTPSSTKPNELEGVLRLLNADCRHLGIKGKLKDVVADEFFGDNGAAVEAVLTLCEYHPEYAVKDNDYATAAYELLYSLESKGAFA